MLNAFHYSNLGLDIKDTEFLNYSLGQGMGFSFAGNFDSFDSGA